MSRVNIMQDIPAQICWEYINGNMRKEDKREIRDMVLIAVPNKRLANQMIYEIAYRVGFAKSNLSKYMSEVTYKQKKKWVRDLINDQSKQK